ncbi:uncharacterized protein LOC135207707 isoform X1 [Macrobrachium nipponense]|uniref:uncharacterized protein LOC135207707 isoform X1 n=1 Tax=Macrobrachium nipponense TaxID=159736 RepID=UPI0030C84C7C
MTSLKSSILRLLLFVCFCASAASSGCDSDQIACSNGDGCVRYHYICDSDDDCDDNSDEDADLCYAWKSYNCTRGQTSCTRNGETTCVPIMSYCLMDAPPCKGDIDRRVCEMLRGGILSELSNFVAPDPVSESSLNRSELLADKFKELIPNTLSHDGCPQMYTKLGEQCLSLFYLGKISWSESREFCTMIKGELITLPDIVHYAKVVQHLQQYEITSDFWIGGTMENEEQGWTWIDGASIHKGSPFWATRYSPVCVNRNVTASRSDQVCYEYEQAPKAVGVTEQCLSLSFEHYFHMLDSDCMEKKSPLCVYKGEKVE